MAYTETSCAVSVLETVNSLVTSGNYDWCNLKTNMDQLNAWFDPSQSFAQALWFNSNLWNVQINQGQQIIFTSQQIGFIIVSLLANALVIFYHITNPPHPKFHLNVITKATIKIHVLSGIVGVILPLFVFFSTFNQSALIVVMFVCVSFDCMFAVTAAIQAPNVYGVRILTVPLYYTCIFFKFVLIACLLQSLCVFPVGGFKTQVEWLWLCWVLHQTYAWVRVWYFFFYWTDSFHACQYTVSVFLAGAMCGGAAVGFYLWLIWMTFTFIYRQYLNFKASQLHKEFTSLLKNQTEAARKRKYLISLDAAFYVEQWLELQANTFRGYEDGIAIAHQVLDEHNIDVLSPDIYKIPKEIKSEMLFRTIDIDNSLFITKNEVELFLLRFGVTNAHIEANKLVTKANYNDGKYNAKEGSIQDESTVSSLCINSKQFCDHFELFYTYAFDGIIEMIRCVLTKKTTRNIFDKLSTEGFLADSVSETWRHALKVHVEENTTVKEATSM